MPAQASAARCTSSTVTPGRLAHRNKSLPTRRAPMNAGWASPTPAASRGADNITRTSTKSSPRSARESERSKPSKARATESSRASGSGRDAPSSGRRATRRPGGWEGPKWRLPSWVGWALQPGGSGTFTPTRRGGGEAAPSSTRSGGDRSRQPSPPHPPTPGRPHGERHQGGPDSGGRTAPHLLLHLARHRRRRRAALGAEVLHLAGTLEDDAPVHGERGRLQVALHPRGRVQLDELRGAHVALHGAIDDDGTGVDLRLDAGALT